MPVPEWLAVVIYLTGVVQGASLCGIIIGRGPFWNGWRDASSLFLSRLFRSRPDPTSSPKMEGGRDV